MEPNFREQKLPSFLTITILDHAYEYVKYAFLAFPPRVRQHVRKVLKSEYFQWFYLLEYDSYFANKCLWSNNIEIIKLGIKYGATNMNLISNDIKNFDLENNNLKQGISNFDIFLQSSNLEVVRLAIEKGATNFNNCLYSQNVEVIKLGLKMGADINSLYVYPNNAEAILFILRVLGKI